MLEVTPTLVENWADVAQAAAALEAGPASEFILVIDDPHGLELPL
jgi:hypothetical protein